MKKLTMKKLTMKQKHMIKSVCLGLAAVGGIIAVVFESVIALRIFLVLVGIVLLVALSEPEESALETEEDEK